jgi:hypothetical protein
VGFTPKQAKKIPFHGFLKHSKTRTAQQIKEQYLQIEKA